MNEFFDQVDRKVCVKNETRNIIFYANGSTSGSVTIPAQRGEDELWKIKKRLLKKLSFKNYKSAQLQSELRLFTAKGIELSEDDVDELFKQNSIFYSINDDFDHTVRVNALKFKKYLGKGGFGEVNMCIDEFSGE